MSLDLLGIGGALHVGVEALNLHDIRSLREDDMIVIYHRPLIIC